VFRFIFVAFLSKSGEQSASTRRDFFGPTVQRGLHRSRVELRLGIITGHTAKMPSTDAAHTYR
jgi:hypothetical protein